MPNGKNRTRVDWCPGDAALEAVELGRDTFPTLSRQAVIDRLVITGIYAILGPRWHEPPLLGGNRERWQLPADMRPTTGNRASTRRDKGQFPGVPTVGASWPVKPNHQEPNT